MLRKDVKDLIAYHVQEYGRGYGYEIYLNGRRVYNITQLKRSAEEGDTVHIEVYRGHGRYSGGYVCDSVRFSIEPDEYKINEIREMRKRDREWRKRYRRPRDFQRQKLYNWERKFVTEFYGKGGEKLEWDDAVQFVTDIWEELGLQRPSMKFHAGRKRNCTYYASWHEIRMGPWGLTKPILIHESAHGLIKQAGLSGRVASHGPAFVRAYIEMLDQFHEPSDKYELAKTARDAGLKVLDKPFDAHALREAHQNGKLTEDMVEQMRMRSTTAKSDLTEAQKRALKALNSGQRDIDGRSGRALVNRDLAFQTADGYYKLTDNGKKLV